MFRSFHFWFLVTFGDEVTKVLLNLCLHFARQDGKNPEKKSHNKSDQNTTSQKKKIRDERNISKARLFLGTDVPTF